MQQAGSALRSLLNDLGLEVGVRLYRVRRHWHSAFGAPISKHTMPVSLTDGRLVINVDSPAWLQQMSYYRVQVIDKLSSFGVTDVRFKVGRVQKDRPAPPEEHTPLSDDERSAISKIAGSVNDPELGGSIRAAMESWAQKRRHRAR